MLSITLLFSCAQLPFPWVIHMVQECCQSSGYCLTFRKQKRSRPSPFYLQGRWEVKRLMQIKNVPTKHQKFYYCEEFLVGTGCNFWFPPISNVNFFLWSFPHTAISIIFLKCCLFAFVCLFLAVKWFELRNASFQWLRKQSKSSTLYTPPVLFVLSSEINIFIHYNYNKT